MKVTFLIPPVLDGTHDVDRTSGCNYCNYFLPLLPMLYTATVLKEAGVGVAIIDFPAQKKSAAEFREFIARDDSDIYFMYTVFLCQKTDIIARDAVRAARRENAGGNARFIFSGPQPTYAPAVFLDSIDTFVIRGEPEFTTRSLVNALKADVFSPACASGSAAAGVFSPAASDVQGVSWFDGTRVVDNPSVPYIANLDDIPIPDRTLLDHRPYYNPKLSSTPHASLMTSRGCYGRCWYCVPCSIDYTRELEHKRCHGKKPPPRLYSTARAIAEFREVARLGFKSVSVLDDEFLWDEKRTVELCRGIAPLGLEWSCLARPDMITDVTAAAMAAAGCAYVDLGAESFDPEVLKAIGKDMSPEDIKRASRTLRAHGIEVELNILFGATPVETEATIRKTMKELRKVDADYVLFSIANPFPGTEFYEAAKREGWMCYGDYVPVDPAKRSIISYPHLPKERLERLIASAYLGYYFHPRYLLRQLLRVKSPRDLVNKISTAMSLLAKNFSGRS